MKQEVIKKLKALEGLRQSAQSIQKQIEILEGALQVLSPEERLVAEFLLISPEKGNVQRLCEMLCVEQSSIYRRRERVLEKLAKVLIWEQTA